MNCVIHRLSVAALLAAAVLPVGGLGMAHAEPVIDRVFSSADVFEKKGCAIVRLGFNFRVRYVSHFPLENGTDVRIAFRAIDPEIAKAQILTRQESLRAPQSKTAAIKSIEFEASKGTGLSVLVTFEHRVNFKVAQGGDFESLVIAVSSGKKSTKCIPNFPADASSGTWNPTVATVDPTSPPEAAAGDAKLDNSARKSISQAMAAAQKALAAKDYDTAVRQLTKVLSYPENSRSAEAQELLGLARQRKGQLAHARAEYEEYLHRYPDGEGADRVRQRLASLDADSTAKTTGGTGAGQPGADATRISGSLSQFYIRDDGLRTFRDPSLPPNPNDPNDDHSVFRDELLTGLDVTAQWSTPGLRSKLRFSGAMENDFNGTDDAIYSVASLYLDSAVKDWDLTARLGRQTRNTGGVFGRFDGGLVSWQATPDLRLNTIAGSPVSRRRDAPFKDGKYFYGASADFGAVLDMFETSVYALDQQDDGFIDRQAVGFESRYSDASKSLFATIDYDFHYNAINLALLTGSWTLADKSTFNFAADHRKSPFLQTSNALQGQLFGSLDGLGGLLTTDEIDQLALDRTAAITSLSIGFSRPLDDTFQINLDAAVANISSTPASGGVEAVESTGNEFYYSALLIGNGVFRENDSVTVGARYADRQSSDTYVLDLATRYPLTPDLRITPRLRLSYRDGKLTDWTEQAILPSVGLKYNWTKDLGLEFEAGAKWSTREEGTAVEEELEYFFLIGYRYDFDAEFGSFMK